MPQESPDRFAVPKACLVAPAVGAPLLGLPDKISKRCVQYHFEAEKAHNNAAASDKSSATPGGRRFAEKREQSARIEEHRASYDDWKRPNKPAFKETLTSLDNPLRTPANDASGLPFYQQRGITAQQEKEEGPKGKRCFPPNERYGTMQQLKADGSLMPASMEEMKEARAVARAAVKSPRPGTASGGAGARQQQGGRAAAGLRQHGAQRSRTSGEQGGASDGEQDHEYDDGYEGQQDEEGGDQEPGQHEGYDDEGDEEQLKGLQGGQEEEEDASAFPTKDQSRIEAARKAQMAKAAALIEEAKQMEAKLLKEYPHGVPKHILLKLQREKPHLSMPTLGFGFPQSLSSAAAAATLARR